MEPVLLGVAQEQAGVWAAEAAGEGWEETVLVQARVDIAYAQVAEQGFLISQVHPAIR